MEQNISDKLKYKYKIYNILWIRHRNFSPYKWENAKFEQFLKTSTSKSWTYRIFESRIAVTSLGGSRRALAPHAIVRWNAVEAVSVQGYRSAPFSVVEPRLPLSHYKLQVMLQLRLTVAVFDKTNAKANLAALLFATLCSITIIGLRILTISRNAVAVNLVAMHRIESCNLPACKIYL